MNRREKAKMATAITMLAECCECSFKELVETLRAIHISEEDCEVMDFYISENYDNEWAGKPHQSIQR